jgi:short-subunit dehydrogenase
VNTLADSQTIWIIGASKGIGAALVQQLDQPGRSLFLSARHQGPLAEVAKQLTASAIAVPLDMTNKSSVSQAVQSIKSHTDSLDMVIVNAGTCEYIGSHEIELAAIKRVMETNFWGALHLINAALPLLRKARQLKPAQQPKLVVMSSSVTYQALPRAGAYGASKAALRYFTECLKIDLQHEGIDVRVVSPGFVKTPLTDKNDFSMPFIINADRAASYIVKGLASKRFDIHFPGRLTRLLKAIALLPDSLRFKLTGKLSRHRAKVPDKTHSGTEKDP